MDLWFGRIHFDHFSSFCAGPAAVLSRAGRSAAAAANDRRDRWGVLSGASV